MIQMKNTLFLAAFVAALSITSFSQVTNAKITAAVAKFPGVSRPQMEQLLTAKIAVGIALPTWLPAGFTLEKIQSRIGRRVSLEDREFIIIYSRKLANGKRQRFAFEAGFDGLGGLPYDTTKTLRTPVGPIDLMYEPKDEDGSKIKDYVITEWFTIGRNAVHYLGTYGDGDEDKTVAVIPLADTEKILRSLNRL